VLRRRGRQPNERGATLVEFAFVLPLFILLLFAIIDFGWLFTQFLDVKQGAREGARLAIVNNCDQSSASACRDDLVEKICDRTADLDDDDTTVTLTPGAGTAEVTVAYPARSLTGMMAVFVNSKTLTAKVQMQQEQPLLWSGGTFGCP
jgi:Flp pilus assembly protein TadG